MSVFSSLVSKLNSIGGNVKSGQTLLMLFGEISFNACSSAARIRSDGT